MCAFSASEVSRAVCQQARAGGSVRGKARLAAALRKQQLHYDVQPDWARLQVGLGSPAVPCPAWGGTGLEGTRLCSLLQPPFMAGVCLQDGENSLMTALFPQRELLYKCFSPHH